MSQFNKLFIYRKKLVRPYITRALSALNVACYIMALAFILATVYQHGFRISKADLDIVFKIYKYVWAIFFASSVANITLDFQNVRKQFNILSWVLHSLLYLTAIPILFDVPIESGFLTSIWEALATPRLLKITLSMLSILQISRGVVSLLSKRANPSMILSGSFLIFILIGTAMLMLPRATVAGISFIDALFMSTSAVCVTGLTTVDVATTFTPLGLVFIIILIQVGGLGVMTLTSFFAMFFMGGASLGNQAMVSDMVSSKSLNSLLTTLLYILGFTFIIEAIGAAMIFANIHSTMGMTLDEEIGFSIFHSISAFCNAGFSTLQDNLGHKAIMQGHNVFYLTISALIVLGGIGFPILVNLYQSLKYHTHKLYERLIMRRKRLNKKAHIYDINTRIVISMTIVLLVAGTLAIAILEWNKGFAGMSTVDKCVHSVFNAACPRTAGFSSVPISSFTLQTILILIALMVIGGGTQSTAGGLKVNVFAVVLLNLRAIIYGHETVTVYNREISGDSIRRSNSTLVLYILFITVALFMLTIFEPNIPLHKLMFEAVSALSTVGSSLGVTSQLGNDSKSVIIALMFIGRVGVLTMMSSLIRKKKVAQYRYPSGNIIIN